MRKIGILGGTFNPIHNGHLAIGKAALRRLKLDEVLFMPACIPPHKQNVPMTAGDLRAEMVEAAIADEPSFSCSRLELEKDNEGFLETLCEGPGDEQYLVKLDDVDSESRTFDRTVYHVMVTTFRRDDGRLIPVITL